ncbi:Kdo hydroxylase family protein [Methylibium sp.]|uniref:Kdo hydroxylase family protein n=1 Tax=Methylibium sp. TaxID=2067992 RepID=UPI003D1141FD
MTLLQRLRTRLARWLLLPAVSLLASADGWGEDESRRRRPAGQPLAAVTPVREFPDPRFADGPTSAVEAVLEDGDVLSFPAMPFALAGGEERFLDERWTDGKAKNVSLRWPAGELRGAAGAAADLAALQAMIGRYAEMSEALALRLFPHYRGHLRRGNTSLRPAEIAGRRTSWRKDDTRLHVDAFPSNPMQGTRLLRVFCNINAQGQPRRWRVGEPFEAHARRYLPDLTRPLPGVARLMEMIGITKRRRSEYDHVMLQLHDRAKSDAEFQRASPQARADFAPGTTWVVFSDQVPHAAMSGQHMLEQTFYLEVEHLLQPQTSPLRTLERLAGRSLL